MEVNVVSPADAAASSLALLLFEGQYKEVACIAAVELLAREAIASWILVSFAQAQFCASGEGGNGHDRSGLEPSPALGNPKLEELWMELLAGEQLVKNGQVVQQEEDAEDSGDDEDDDGEDDDPEGDGEDDDADEGDDDGDEDGDDDDGDEGGDAADDEDDKGDEDDEDGDDDDDGEPDDEAGPDEDDDDDEDEDDDDDDEEEDETPKSKKTKR